MQDPPVALHLNQAPKPLDSSALPSSAPPAPSRTAAPYALFACALFHCCMSGAFYGFWQAAIMLQGEGGYRESCDSGSPLSEGCTAQTLVFSTLFTYTSVLAFGVPLVSGLLMPTLGPRLTVLGLTSCFAAGFALLLAATFQPPGQLASSLILPGLACIAVSAAANYLPLLSLASLFQHSGLALSLLSGSFDTGSGVFLVMRLLWATGVPLRTLLAAYLGGPILLMLAMALLLWKDRPFQPAAAASSSSSSESSSGSTSPRLTAALAASGSVHGGSAAFSLEAGDSSSSSSSAPALPPPPPFLPALTSLHALPMWRQMASAEYLAFLAYFCALALRFNYYLASVAAQLGALGPPGSAGPYLDALGYLMPTLAIPAVLCAGGVLDRWGPLAGLTLLSSLATLLSALQLVPSLQLQGLTALVFVAFRGTLFSCLSVFLSVLFGFSSLSALVGVITALSGVFSLLSTPLVQWGLLGGFAAPNGLLLALSAASFAFPAWVAVRGGHANLLRALLLHRQ